MGEIARSEKYDDLAKRLTTKTLSNGEKMFSSFMQLSLFAAMVGYKHGETEKTDSRKLIIPESVFVNSKKEPLIYLLALQDRKDGEILRDTNDEECWKIFEEYANAGMNIINGWLLDNPSDIDGVDTIIQKIIDEYVEHKTDLNDSEDDNAVTF